MLGNDLQGNNIDQFIQNYREAMQKQYEASQKNLEQTRINDHTNIMSNANTAGVMYSNFPTRDKIKYDTSTYMPNLIKVRNTYQTGLDKLRANALNAYNTVQYYKTMMNHYNGLQ